MASGRRTVAITAALAPRRESGGTDRPAAAQNCPMDTDLTAIKAALADISDTELAAPITATYGVPKTAPGLLA